MTKNKKFKNKNKMKIIKLTQLDYYFQIKHMGQHHNEDYLLCD